MRNFSKMRFTRLFGIIAVIAVIGLFFSCGDEEASPDDQTKVTITGLPNGANDKYAVIGLVGGETTFEASAVVASALDPARIRGGSLTGEMYDYTSKLAWGKDDSLWVVIGIYATAADARTEGSEGLYFGKTTAKKAITKGSVSFSINDFIGDPDIEDVIWGQPSAQGYGEYSGAGFDANHKEFIDLSLDEFKITEKTTAGATTGEYLTFKIENWDIVTTGIPAGYTNGYKFTGRILTQNGYVPSDKTAPGFVASTDVNVNGTGTECWMYIYLTGTAPNITFVRTAFSKSGKESTTIITGSDSQPRVYTKTATN